MSDVIEIDKSIVIKADERSVLMELFKAKESIKEWVGVKVDFDGYAIEVDLSRRGLTGYFYHPPICSFSHSS